MIAGFTLSPLAEMPPSLCAVIQSSDVPDAVSCACTPRIRTAVTTSLKVPRNGVIKVFTGDAVAIECQHHAVEWGGNAPTAADVQLRPFVTGGDVYIKLIDGRVGRIVTETFNVFDSDGTFTPLTVTLEII